MHATSFRLRFVLSFALSFIAGSIEAKGLEHLKELEGKRVIFATSHLSNLDMLAAMKVLAPYYNLKTVNKSIHYSLFQRPIERIAMTVAGAWNFMPISYRLIDDQEYACFVSSDYAPMKKSLEKGDAILIAAHNPSINWKLPPTAGYGAVYLSEITPSSVIVPVTINVESDQPAGMADLMPYGVFSKTERIESFFQRPDVTVTIHRPLAPATLPQLERFQELANRFDVLSASEKEEFSVLREMRRQEGEKIMETIASALPAGKQHYGQSEDASEEKVPHPIHSAVV